MPSINKRWLRRMGVALVLSLSTLFAAWGCSDDSDETEPNGTPSPTDATAMTIVVSPTEGRDGDEISVSGEGFESGGLIFLEVFPVDTFGGVIPLGDLTADDSGEFDVVFHIGYAYPGPDVPSQAPVGGGQPLTMKPGDWIVRAYPESLGERTEATLKRAPKAALTITQ